MLQKAISVLQKGLCLQRESMFDSFAISQDVLLKNSRMTGDLKRHDDHVASLL